MTSNDPFVVSPSTAVGMSEHLLIVLNTIIKNLPESELREVRASLEETSNVADDILYNMTISSTFEMLSVNEASTIPREEICATSVSASHVDYHTRARRKDTHVPNVFLPPSSPSSGKTKKGRSNKNEFTAVRQSVAARDEVPAPSPTRDPTPAPTRYPTPEPTLVAVNTDGPKIIISSRPNVGIPDYRYHPAFIQPGIPGPYTTPPVEPGQMPLGYYVVTKGLYVGIFTSWLECSPWVQKVAGSTHVKVRQWHEAANLYNACLASGSCQVLR